MAVEDLYTKACDAVERANYDYAVELFREVLRHTPDYPNARMALRGTERRRIQEKGRSVGALLTGPLRAAVTALKGAAAKAPKRIEIFEDYLETNPNSFWALSRVAAAAVKAGHKEEGVNLYRDALKVKPTDKAALRAVGDVLIDMGQHQEALKYLNRLAGLDPKDRDLQREVRDLSATQHMVSHDMESAESFRDMIRDKTMAEQLEAKGRMAVTMDDLRRSIEEAERELAEHPTNVPRILGLAQKYLDTGQLPKAQAFLREKHKALPDNYEVREKLGDAQLLAHEATVRAAQEAARANPADEAAGQKARDLQQRLRAFRIKEYNWRLSQHPTDRHIQLMLGRAYFDDGKYNEAIAACQIAAQDARFELESFKILGQAFLHKKQFDLALEQFGRAIASHGEMDDEGKDLYYCQAEALEAMGNREEALKVYKRIYSQDINFRDVAAKVDALSA
ncbi:MAG: tetratricopeptide repeat protein [Candidatus Brocadiaceae bacterium]|nr:tetratricopeptide repeat protein [Candidatus Brocadiaceae bacterium]